MSKNRLRQHASYPAMRLALLAMAFFIGGIFAKNDWQPFEYFYRGYIDFNTLARELTQVRPSLVQSRRYGADGVILHEKFGSYSGFTIMQGLFHDGAQVRLINMDGSLVHSWNIDFFQIWPDPRHIYPEKNIPKTDFSYHTQGMCVLKDGSIVVSISNLGTAKLDKCSNVLWTLNRMTHHSVTPTDDGRFWIPGNRAVDKIPADLLLPGVTKKYLEESLGKYENILILVDDKGRVVKEFSVLRALVNGSFENQLFDALIIDKSDPTHVNDIEIVTDALAVKIPGVNTGDLLISLRQMHMLAILDGESGQIKWHYRGPWVRQHDPDITANGTIVVFNNGYYPLSLKRRIPGSNLIELDPATGESRIIYPTGNGRAFYSDIMGNHQLLPNHNRLIVESRAGRIFEINSNGKIVWDFIQPYDNTHASLIEMAERLATDFFEVENWECE